jgi:group I intron endonuclease
MRRLPIISLLIEEMKNSSGIPITSSLYVLGAISERPYRKWQNGGAMTGIYRIYNTIDGKSYVGQSRNIAARFSKHRRSERNRPLKKAFKDYGMEAFTFEVLEELDTPTQQLLDDREVFFMEQYQSLSNGYNVRGGGKGGKHSEETKKRIAKKVKKRKGAVLPMSGMNVLGEIAHAIPSADALKAVHNKRIARGVRCLETGQVFSSAKEASSFIGQPSIYRALNGKHKKVGGYHWDYV